MCPNLEIVTTLNKDVECGRISYRELTTKHYFFSYYSHFQIESGMALSLFIKLASLGQFF